MSFDGAERRCEPRIPFYCPIEFALKSDPDKILKGAVHDINRLGLGMTSYTQLSAGQEIIIKSIIPTSYTEYTVRWSVKVKEDLFSVGLRAKE
jgi:hypothetical protein